MKLKISHETRYKYSEPVSYLLQQLRLTPKQDDNQAVISWETVIEGGVKEVDFLDQYNNNVTLCSIEAGLDEIAIISRGEVVVNNNSGIVKERGSFAPLWLFERETHSTKSGKGISNLVKPFNMEHGKEVSLLHELSGHICDTVEYETGFTDSKTTAEDAIELGKGVCQDHAHIFLACARRLGFPARYVSGYLMMNDRIDQDASHAWAEVFIQSLGWVGFDVSNGISPDDRYVRLAIGLDYRDAAPISGMRLGQSSELMDVSLQVQQQ